MDKKALSLPILISLVVGHMIGTGIYTLPAALAQYGSISLLAWVFTSIGALFLAYTFTRLNKRFPQTGGPYAFCKHAFGRPYGFTIAIIYWLSNLVSVAGISVAAVGYLGFVFPLLNSNAHAYNQNFVLLVELLVVWAFVLVNIIGIHVAGVVQLFLTIIKLTPLVLVVLFGLGKIQLSHLTPFVIGNIPHFQAVSSAAALTFWAFIGLESATVPAENTSGSRVIFKATMIGTSISSFIYIASTFVLMGLIPVLQLRNTQFPFADAGTMLFGAYAAYIIAICAFISGLGALNACVLVQGQVVFAAARDNLFPKSFAKLSKHDVPINAQLLSGVLITLLLIVTMNPSLLRQFENIGLLASFLTLTSYLSMTIAEIKFTLQERASILSLMLNKSLLVTLLAAIYSIWMIMSIEATIIKVGFTVIALCIMLYYFTARKYTHE